MVKAISTILFTIEKTSARRLSLKKALLLLRVTVLLTVCGGGGDVQEDPSKPKAWHVSTLAGGGSGNPVGMVLAPR